MEATIKTAFDTGDKVRTKPAKRNERRGVVRFIHIKIFPNKRYTTVYTVDVAGRDSLIEESFLERDV